MPTIFHRRSRQEPARTIIFVVAALGIIAGLWLLTPWAISTIATPAVAAGFDWSIKLGALVNLAVLAPALWMVKKGTPKHLSWGSLILFNWFLFVTLTRLVMLPLGSTAFIAPLMIALIMAVIHIEQEHVAKVAAEGSDDA